MKAKSRRRLLISSVAMLLVAMLALGTATFAWFSTKTTADAKGVKVKTAQASSLVLSLDQQTWASTIDLDINDGNDPKGPKTLDPCSTANLTNWYTATSTGYDQGTVDVNTIEGATANTNYIAKTFYIKSIGEDLQVDWSLLFSQSQVATDKNYMRAAMTITDTTTNQVFWWSDDGTTTDALTGGTKVVEEVTLPNTSAVSSSANTTGQLQSTALTADKVYTLNLYVWFEGQDAQCIDSKAGTVCDFDLQFAKRSA